MTIVPSQPRTGPPTAPGAPHVARAPGTPVLALPLPRNGGEPSDVLPEPVRPAYVPDMSPEPVGPARQPRAKARRKGRRARRR